MNGPKIGIVGGGQLAGLLAQALKPLGAELHSLDPDPECPAVTMGAVHVPGDRHSAKDMERLSRQVDVITVDLEDVNTAALMSLEEKGASICPRAATLKQMTNKLRQKEVLAEAGLPTSPFTPCDDSDASLLGSQGWPAVQKSAEGGYDGRGVAILQGPEDIDQRLRTPGFVEAFVPDALELSVMVARDEKGEEASWQTVEMDFDTRGNLLTWLIAPARIQPDIAETARKLAREAVRAFNGIGIFGVELFLTREGQLLINEIAPRTHNSGHYTIDACETSQFMQQYRILTGQPLGPTRQHSPAVMFNLLGEPGYEGKTVVEGLDRLLETPGVHPYLYGKQKCFPLRKMGHVTVVADKIETAQSLANLAKSQILVHGEKRIEA